MSAGESPNVGALLREHARRLAEAGLESARLEAEVLLAHGLSVDRSWLIGHAHDTLSPACRAAAELRLRRRLAGEPIAWITGRREFWSLDFEVTPRTLIPRPETELLVELALARLPAGSPVEVADLGTGTGVLAVCIARERPLARVVATDVDDDTLAVAARNIARLAPARVELRAGHWWQPLAGRRFDLVVSNPPYIAAGDPHLATGDVAREARLALTSGDGGLDALCEIAAGAPAHLAAGGWLLLEHGWQQGPQVRDLLRAAGFIEVQTMADPGGRPRVSLGRLPG